MPGRIQWRVRPIDARGFGPHQVTVYMASVYLGSDCLDSVVCARWQDAQVAARDMALHHRNVRLASSDARPCSDAAREGSE